MSLLEKYGVSIEEYLDKKTLTKTELAVKWNTTEQLVQMEIDKGMLVEQEHTSNLEIANEIARDHLSEDLKYYDKLAEIEAK